MLDGDLMGNGRAENSNQLHVLPAVFHGFANRIGHTPGLANSHTHFAIVIANDYSDAEAKCPTTLYYLGYTGDINHPLFKFFCLI
jgi:hypothetical protein